MHASSPKTFIFDESEAQRLDKFLVECLPELSRARLQALIKDGMVTVDGNLPRKTGFILERGSQIQVNIPPPLPSLLVPEDIPLDIVYEDEHMLVINKPAGMVVHPSAGHDRGTLVHAVLAHTPELEGVGGKQRPGVVHRLDKNTSGLILLAKNDLTHRWLQDQFRLHKVQKAYLALVDGHPPSKAGRIEADIGRDPKARQKMAIVVAGKGRPAISEYLTLESFLNHTYLEVRPITGRTHQIRLHLAFLDCPVAGDTVYGNRRSTIPLERHFLHAARLTLQLNSDSRPHTFEAPLPEELAEVLRLLRSDSV